MKKIILMFVLIFLFPLVNSDILSINSGGSEEVVINPGAYIEGFFSCIPYTCSGLGYECGSWADGCGGTLNCGTCASGYTCTSGICVAVPSDEEEGGGGGTGVVVPTTPLLVSPMEFNINLAVNTNKEETISVTNLGTSAVNISVKQQNLDNMVILEQTFLELAAGESKNLNLVFVALSQTGIFTGKILVGTKQVLVSLNIKTKLSLFDSNIVVLNKDYLVEQGDDLKTEVTLIPMGDPDRLDVTLNYLIKDYNNKVYLTKSETLLVEEEMDFKRDFGTGILPLGDYIIGLELIYPNGIAPSSAHFQVIEKKPTSFFGKLAFFLIILILIVSILIVLFFIIRRLNKKKEQTSTI